MVKLLIPTQTESCGRREVAICFDKDNSRLKEEEFGQPITVGGELMSTVGQAEWRKADNGGYGGWSRGGVRE